jgi:phosphatidylserine synthase
MVSNFAYQSHKMIKFHTLSPFKLLVCAVLALSVLAYEPHLLLFFACTLYALSGPVGWAVGWKKAHEDHDIFESHDLNDSVMEPHSAEEHKL